MVAARKLEMVSPPATLTMDDQVSKFSVMIRCSVICAATYTRVDVWALSSSSDTSPALTFPTRLVMKSFLSLVLFKRLQKISIHLGGTAVISPIDELSSIYRVLRLDSRGERSD